MPIESDPVVADCLQTLAKVADPAGGWGYHPGGVPQVEPTVFALLALDLDRDRQQVLLDAGLNALRGWQAPDGAFPVRGGYERSGWPTALALVALNALERQPDGAGRRAADWLCATAGRTIEQKPESPRANEIDASIPGWPWTADSFSWVDPTAWACLALRQAGHGTHPRVREGLRLLLDRAYEEGGANAGNRKVFGSLSEPVPANTASLLLAFAGLEDHPKLKASRRFLLTVAASNEDLENLCWTRLALESWKHAPGVAEVIPALEERLRATHALRQGNPVFPVSILREALAALALGARLSNPLLATKVRTPAPPAPDPSRAPEPPEHDRLKAGVCTTMVRSAGRIPVVPAETAVHIARVAGYEADLARVLGEQYAAFRAAVPLKDQRVVLKPNFVEYNPERVINTHPAVIAGAIELCRREGAREVVVAEGPGHWRNVESIVTASGLGEVLSRHGTAFVDLNHDDPVKVQNSGMLTRMEHLYLARTIMDADVLISMPKVKTHHWAGVTLSLKNLFGMLPGICYGWPKNELHWRGINNSIVDIALTRRPDLAIVDGIVGMEGDGPLAGEARSLGALIMGTDPLAVDATCCRLMGFDPGKVGHLKLAELFGVGLLREDRIRQVGAAIPDVAQPFVPHPRFACLRPGTAGSAASASPSGPPNPAHDLGMI